MSAPQPTDSCARCGVDRLEVVVPVDGAAWCVNCADSRGAEIVDLDAARATRASGSSILSSLVVPYPSSLVPSNAEEEEAEVEGLLRMADDGRLEPVAVRLPPLPDNASPLDIALAELYQRVRGVRLWAGDDRDVPFACGFIARKLDLPHKMTAWRALERLEAAGVLRCTGELPGRGKRGTRLYRPGSAG